MSNLSIAQAYMVCAANEKGKISSFDTEGQVCLAAAGLIELRGEGCIDFDGKEVRATAPLPRDAPIFVRCTISSPSTAR